MRGRGGQLLGRLITDKGEVSVGRAFSNDLIVDDPYVNPHHLRLMAMDGGWQAHDLGSVNGVHHRGTGAGADSLVRSGDTLRIGHTVLRVYGDDHPVAPALRLGGWEDRLSLLGRHTIWPALAGLNILVSVMSSYRHTWLEFEPQIFLEPLTANLGLPLLFALLWALLGRLLRHRAHLLAHFGIWLSFGLLSQWTTWMAGLAGYNAGSAAVESVLDQGSGFLLLACALTGSLLLATSLRHRGRWLCAFGIALVFVVIGALSEYPLRNRFSAFPRYYNRLAASTWRWVPPESEADLVDRLPGLIVRAGEAIIEDEPARAGGAPPETSPDDEQGAEERGMPDVRSGG